MSGKDRANIKIYLQNYAHVYNKSNQRGERGKKAMLQIKSSIVS